MKRRSYLDYNATAPLRPAVREAMVEALDLCGNPSSVHCEGREARAAVEKARAQVAGLVGVEPNQVVFTSGGSEANALALSLRRRGERPAAYVSAIEHPSVLSCGGDEPARLPVTETGLLDLQALANCASEAHLQGEAQDRPAPVFSVMAANNETGVIQPVAEAAEIVHAAGGILHVDAVQAAGKVALNFQASGADLMSLSAHKLGGPKGIGALVLREGLKIEPLITGGAQETRRRAGTENVAAIVGFGVAAELAAGHSMREAVRPLKERLEEEAIAAVSETVIFGAGVDRLPNTVCLAVPATKAETLVIGLDLAGVAISSGSACSSGKVERSHVLEAMGVPPKLAEGAIRVSLGWETEETDVERFLSAWVALVKRQQAPAEAAA
ncbi:Cysteine desulfurase [Methyloligella halotolerans]|uniref:Cysteine desulfurase n=1 Tax=Methyloligella halotolerans TaxID=1177755 RepID=A0A1E2S303_9HYPH|nr:cysteine desulfurase family protein [Methyloligella halotolerans]ODA68821.1 Cysteine desulfurase [Methyloligella halotolerans]